MQKVWTNCDMSKYCTWGGVPPHDSAIIVWHIAVCSHFLHTLCVLLNFVRTFPLKYIALLRSLLIFQWFRWLFCSFAFTIPLVIERKKWFPRGAKTNESLWKSQNNNNKIKFTFHNIFVYYSPGDRAQKVIPRGAKTNESFWKSQNNVKKSILRFPTFCLL